MQKEDIELFTSILNDLLSEEELTPVAKPIPSDKLSSYFDLKLQEEPAEKTAFEQTLRKIVSNTPKTSSNRFFNQLFGGRSSKATLGELISVLLNNSMYTYKVGGPMIGVEKELIKEICKLAGYENSASGTMPQGGSLANLMGMIMARDYHFPEIRVTGNSKQLIVYVSKEAHYSIKKNMSFMGLGTHNLRVIGTNVEGEMNTELLEQQIITDRNDGRFPFLIVGTAGTTVLGAIDPIENITAIAEKHNLWFHLDASFYGAFLFSKKYRNLLRGIEKTDSFCLNTHKPLSTPLSCSFILTRHKKCLYDSFNSDAEYLYQSGEDDYNPGRISLHCGRRNDALKMWVLWKSAGTRQLGNIIDHEFDMADFSREYIRRNPDYKLLSFNNSLTVCFTYKDISSDVLCEKLNEAGELMVGYGRSNNQSFVRLAIVNGQNKKDDILNFFKRLESFAEIHFQEYPKQK